MNDDLISVIVPAYNAASFIERCLNSILNQTYKNLEIICIDDGSSDNTVEVVRKIGDPRIRLVDRGQNYGISLTRNHGIEIAKGKYIGFIDSDDFIDPDFYEKLHKAAVEHEAEIVTAATSAEWPEKTKIWAGKPGVCTAFADKLKAVKNGSCWNKLYNADFLRQHKLLFPAGLIAEDNFFIIQCLTFCRRLGVIDDTRYHYIMNPGSLTHHPEKEQKRKDDSLTISRMILDFIGQNAPENRKAAVLFIIKNVTAGRYFADDDYYREFRSFAGFSFALLKARLKALRRRKTGKYK